MKIGKHDWLFIGIIAVVVGIFVAISGKEKTRQVPNDSMHQVVYTAAFRNAPGHDAPFFKRAFFKPDKKGAEVFCFPCHKEKGIPFPPKPVHKPTDRCLFCHKLLDLR